MNVELPEDNAREGALDTLIGRYLDRSLGEADAALLVGLLHKDPDSGREFRRQVRTAAQLNDLEKGFGRTPRAADLLAELEQERNREPLVGTPNLDDLSRLAAESPSLPKPVAAIPQTIPAPGDVRQSGYKAAKPLLPLKLLIPSCLAILALAIFFEFNPVPTESESGSDGKFVARITETIDVCMENAADSSFKKGQRLPSGLVAFRSGLLELEYDNGVRVVLEGPAAFHVETPLESACDRGRLSAYVPPAGKGFTVMTPKLTVRDLGTAFFLDVDAERTELHVVEGEVEANWLTKDWLPFKAGRGLERREGKEVRNFVADSAAFVSETKVRRQRSEYVARRQAVWNEQSRRQASDPSLMYRLEPEKVSALDKTPGSREGKQAIRFRKTRDRVEAAPGAECGDMTLLACVRLDEMRNRPNTLVMGDGFQSVSGEFHWQIDRFGSLQFFLQYGDPGIRMFSGPSVLQSKDCRTWIFPAVVVDSGRKTVTHYLDGRAVAELPWKPVPLRPDRLTIGNEQKASNRCFKGDIEDLWIFSRAFDAKEIEDFYRNNN